MVAAKAHAGGFVGALTVLLLYLLEQIPFVASLPDGPETALQFLVAAGVGWLGVYWAPANRPKNYQVRFVHGTVGHSKAPPPAP